MSRLTRPLTFAAIALALTACDGVPNLNLPGESLRGEISGQVTSKTKVAVVEGHALDFTDAQVLRVTNRQFTYRLPDSKTNVFLAAFEDENDNNQWDPGERITSRTDCQSCSYLKLTHDGTSWKVFEIVAGVSQPSTLVNSTIAFNA